jgi:hypothetical protein
VNDKTREILDRLIADGTITAIYAEQNTERSAVWRIFTGGPVVRFTGTLEEMWLFVGRNAPLPHKGWYGEWEKHPTRDVWRYRRFNSRGTHQKSLDLLITTEAAGEN